MNNLFSIFDPKGLFGVRLNWRRRLILIFLCTPVRFWLVSNQLLKIFYIIINYLNNEINLVLGNLKSPGVSHLVLRIFWFIAINNLFGLVSYVFTATRHLVTTLTLGLTFWLRVIIAAVTRDLGSTLAHLVPLGTPVLLMPLIVIIEIVRNVIRPITLSVRLAANIVAGHLLLTLAGGGARPRAVGVTILRLTIISCMLFLELAVALIQSYVFSTLCSLYVGDVNSANTSFWWSSLFKT